jgi:Xaa-Pro aminopeptidase
MQRLLIVLVFLILSPTLASAGSPAGADRLKEDLGKRREAAMEAMNRRGMLVLFSAEQRPRSGNVTYRYRQNNNLYYLTGLDHPQVILALMPQNETFREILFVPQPDPTAEIWTGVALTRDKAAETSGIANVWDLSEFEPFIESLLRGRAYRTDRYAEPTEYEAFLSDLAGGEAEVFLLSDAGSQEMQFAQRLRDTSLNVRVREARTLFHRLRLIKSDYEITQIRAAVDITVEALKEVMRTVSAGQWEYEVEGLIQQVFRSRNAFEAAFPPIVASGPNALTLHYDANNRQLRENELLLMDIGAEFSYYASDITRTIPVSGRFNPEQAEIYSLVLKAQEEALTRVKPDSSLPEIHRQAVRVLEEGLLKLGLIAEADGRQYRVFFPHGTSHWLGMDVHDVGGYGSKLRPGMVLTVEPGLYIRADSLDRLRKQGVSEESLARIKPVLERYKGIGVRIEDDVLVTSQGHEVLSRAAPKQIRELERRHLN